MTIEEKMLSENLVFHQMKITAVGGMRDGESFYLVAESSNPKASFWISDFRPGRFRHVFVPLDFQSSAVIG